jgi:hypothetical protein
MFGTAQPALMAFPDERPVFLREYSTNHYSVFSYFVSRLTMEVVLTALQVLVSCILNYFMIGFKAGFAIYYAAVYCLAMASTALAVLLGCAVEDPKLAQELLPLLFVRKYYGSPLYVTELLFELSSNRFICLIFQLKCFLLGSLWLPI